MANRFSTFFRSAKLWVHRRSESREVVSNGECLFILPLDQIPQKFHLPIRGYGCWEEGIDTPFPIPLRRALSRYLRDESCVSLTVEKRAIRHGDYIVRLLVDSTGVLQIPVQRKYLQYTAFFFGKGLTFKTTSQWAPVALYQGKRYVGCIMPIRV